MEWSGAAGNNTAEERVMRARRTQCVREDICSFVTTANLLVFSSTGASQPPSFIPLKPWWPLSPRPARLYYSPAAQEIAGDKESHEISY